MNDASVRTFVLKMDEPGLTGLRVDPSSLVRPIDAALALREHHSSFIRAINIFGAQGQLPARLNASRRRKDVVETVSLIQLWALDRRIALVPVKDHRAIVEEFGAVLAHAAYNQDAFDSRTTARKGTHEIGLAVVIPERTRIDPAFGLF